MKPARVLLTFGFALTAFAAAAQAPSTHYTLQEMNFDVWCQETKHYPPARCDKRLPADDKEFQAYVGEIQKYEIPYLQRRQKEQEQNRTIIHGDPLDNRRTPPDVPPGSAGTTPQL